MESVVVSFMAVPIYNHRNVHCSLLLSKEAVYVAVSYVNAKGDERRWRGGKGGYVIDLRVNGSGCRGVKYQTKELQSHYTDLHAATWSQSAVNHSHVRKK